MTTAAAPVAEVRRTDRVRRLPGPGARFLELFTLSGFAVAEPLYSVFRDAPEEFIFRRISEERSVSSLFD